MIDSADPRPGLKPGLAGRASSLRPCLQQRVYQMAAGYEDCNDADFLRVDPALRLSLDKGADLGASQSMLSRLENEILDNAEGLKALDEAILRAADALTKNQLTPIFLERALARPAARGR